MMQGVGELEALVRDALSRESGTIRLSPGMGAELVAYMNSMSDNPYQHIDRIYWAINVAAVEGIIDQVKTALVSLVAELRMAMPSNEGQPSTADVNNAFSLVVEGKGHRVNVTTASGDGTATASVANGDHQPLLWKGIKIAGYVAVGLATIAAAAFGYIQISGS